MLAYDFSLVIDFDSIRLAAKPAAPHFRHINRSSPEDELLKLQMTYTAEQWDWYIALQAYGYSLVIGFGIVGLATTPHSRHVIVLVLQSNLLCLGIEARANCR